ncbi:DMT family transporter [Nocardioides sp.]|uniref:DMT family transporter n=1 Tax=Nocardioides sp. TaxID=35761 RepID=UPI0035114564
MTARRATPPRLRLAAALALVAMTACWGSTFVLIKDLLDRVPALDFLGVRFAIAALVMAAVAPGALRRLPRPLVRRSVALGALYGAAQIAQTLGLAHTAASVSGFVTGLYVVATPVLAALVLGDRIGARTWLAVLLATLGVATLTLDGLALGYGEALTLVGAILYAAHIVGLAAWTDPAHPVAHTWAMATVQVTVIAVICLVGAAPGGLTLPDRPADWVAVLYMALVAGALALVAQTWAQAHLRPTAAAVIMSMEPVWAAGFAVGLGGESLSGRLAAGGACVLAGMVLVGTATGHDARAGQGVG